MSEIETPRNDSSYGMVLINSGNFNFKTVNAFESGLFSPTDVKKLRLINILGKPHILIGNNNDKIKTLRINWVSIYQKNTNKLVLIVVELLLVELIF